MISEKIVVIDDDRRIIRSIKLAFPEYEIIDFTDGKQALHFLRKPNSINLVLLDVMMPGMDGISLLSEIKQSIKDINVIMMTAFGTKDVILEALRNHADDFVEKPFDPDELKAKISTILNQLLYKKNVKQDKDDQVTRIKRYIERNYHNVSLEFIASELCLSPRYVSRLFKKISKENYRDYRLRVRMERAREYLSGTHLTVSEIAIKLGYQNPETFMRIFKKAENLTPSQYRRKCGGQLRK